MFYTKSLKSVKEELQTNFTTGLSDKEVLNRQKKYGKNILTQGKKKNPIVLFFMQFNSFIIYILLFAVVISLISGEYVDASVILIILLFNAIFGFIQEYKAERAIDALKKLAAFKVEVTRNNKRQIIEAEDLVIPLATATRSEAGIAGRKSSLIQRSSRRSAW